MKRTTLPAVLILVLGGTALATEPSVSKADCDATLSAEIKRMEEGFSRARTAWQASIDQRFEDHEELNAEQMRAARSKFDALVLSQSNEHVKAVALPGLYRMMLAIPQYDLSVCSNPTEVRALGDQAITDFLMRLTELFPFVEASIDAAMENG